jgi:adenylate kinase family enzyme
MKKESKKNNKQIKTIWILLDLVFNGSMNQFEETYGEHITYKELEQYSYIELKDMIVSSIGKVKKIRKVRDDSKKTGLTCRIEMSEEQYEKLLSIYSSSKELGTVNIFKFIYGFVIKNLRKDEEINSSE